MRSRICSETVAANTRMRLASYTGLLVTMYLVTGCSYFSLDRTPNFWATSNLGLRSDSQNTHNREPSNWQWSSGIPTGAAKAELVSAEIPSQVLAKYIPSELNNISLASWDSSASQASIVNVNGVDVSNWSDLQVAVDALKPLPGDPIQVDFATPGGKHIATSIPFGEAVSLVQCVSPEQRLLIGTERGQASYILREGPLQLRVETRLERTRGLLHLVVVLANLSEHVVVVPQEVQVEVDGNYATCLSVSDILQELYGEAKDKVGSQRTVSYREASADPLYRIPVHYKQLENTAPSSSPAFVDVPGAEYPGSSVLADARALSGFLKAPTKTLPREPAQVAWLVFQHPDLRNAEDATVHVTLQGRTTPMRFLFPVAEL